MKMIIVGGGKLGKSLADILLDRKHEVGLIEKNIARCNRLADALDAEVFLGDGSHVEVLETAGAKNADCVMAVTGSDQDNLVVAQIVKHHFHAGKVIARVNDPRNIHTFHVLGIENTVCSTDVIASMIDQEADATNMHLIARINEGSADVCSIHLPKEGAALAGKALKEIDFPGGVLIISIIRNGALIVPGGATVFADGDEVIALTEEKSRRAFMRMIAEKT